MTEPKGLRGIDVSSLQGLIEWDKVAAAGYVFASIRATNGSDADSRAVANAKGARAAGLLPQLYGVQYPSGDPIAQAEAFLRVADQCFDDTIDLPQCQDFEVYAGPWDSKRHMHAPSGSTREIECALKWCERVEAALNRMSVIYTGKGFMAECESTAEFDAALRLRPLWVAHYGVNAPAIPLPWLRAVAWQWAGNAPSVPGIPTMTDRDVFYGDSIDALRTFREASRIVRSVDAAPSMVSNVAPVQAAAQEGESS